MDNWKRETGKEWADRTFERVTWCDRLERIPSDYGEIRPTTNEMPTEEEQKETLDYRLINELPY